MQAYAEPDPSLDEAFERLYRRYVNDVYRYALALLHNPSDAEDVTQTTFLNAYRAFKRGEDPRTPQHWLIKIAHNACRSRYIRTARRPREVPLDESLARVPMPAEDAIDVRELLVALGGLPFNQRAALVMRELDDRSYRDIADTLGVTVSAVETLIFRARRRLRAERAALQALGAVQLPQSLASFFESGGAIASGGAVVGSGGLALKAALMLAAGAVAGSVGYKTVGATAFPLLPAHPSAVRESERPPAGALPPVLTASGASPARVRFTSASDPAAIARVVSVQKASAAADARRVRGISKASPADGALVGIARAGNRPQEGAPAVSPSHPGSLSPSGSVSGSSSGGGSGAVPGSGESPTPPPPPAPVGQVANAVPQAQPPATPVPMPSAPAAPTVPAVPDAVASILPQPPPLPHLP